MQTAPSTELPKKEGTKEGYHSKTPLRCLILADGKQVNHALQAILEYHNKFISKDFKLKQLLLIGPIKEQVISCEEKIDIFHVSTLTKSQ